MAPKSLRHLAEGKNHAEVHLKGRMKDITSRIAPVSLTAIPKR
jgi:hypothetical protein